MYFFLMNASPLIGVPHKCGILELQEEGKGEQEKAVAEPEVAEAPSLSTEVTIP